MQSEKATGDHDNSYATHRDKQSPSTGVNSRAGRLVRWLFLALRVGPLLVGGTLLLIGVVVQAVVGHAQVTTAITSSGLGTTVTPKVNPTGGTTHEITGGTRPKDILGKEGPNLFHSFGLFSVGAGDTANFVNTTPTVMTTNIIGRVTGGERSNIYGTIGTLSYPGANLFLINPAGVVFGPSAKLDVAGSFHVSTADFIRLADGGIFPANPSSPTVLTVAPPASFGFLGPSPAAITVQESVLEVPEGRSLSLVGGNVSITGGPSGLVRARSGRVSVISVASPGEVSFDAATQTPQITAGSFTRLGIIELSNQAFLSTTGAVDGPGSGTIAIRGGRLVMRDSDLRGNSNGDIDGARVGIDVRVTEEAILDNSRMLTGSFAGGRSGDIVVSAPVMTIENGSGVETSTSAGGRAGDVTVAVGRLTVTGGSLIGSSTAGSGEGGAVTIQATDSVSVTGSGPSGPSRLLSSTDSAAASGPITVSASTVSLDSGAVVLSRTTRQASGNAGNILIDADLTLSGESSVSSISFSSGRAGDVTVRARESVSVAQFSQISSTVASRASGNPGRVLITTPVLRVDDDGTIGAQVSSSAAAGAVELRAQTVSLTGGGAIVAGTSGDGGGGTISITGLDPSQPADLVSLSGSGRLGPSEISNQTLGKGSAGRVSVFSRTLNVDGGSIVSNTFSSGDGGDIKLDVGNLTLTNRSFVSSSTGEKATGRGGTVTVEANDSVSLASGSVIGAFSLGSGDAGRISVSAPSLNMSGGSSITTLAAAGGRAGGVVVDSGRGSLRMSGARIDSTTLGAGSGGDIEIRGGDVDLRDGAVISADSQSTGDAGNVSITATSTFRSHDSFITTTATQADGGNIRLNVGSLLQLVDSRITTSVESGQGRGGNITIDPRFVVLDNSQIRADAFGGPGGNVKIVADVYLTTDSVVSASSTLGVPGTINVQASTTNVSATLARLPEAVAQAATLLRASCAARVAAGKASSLVVAGREGVPLEPGGYLPSPLMAEELGSAEPSRSEGHHWETFPRLSRAVLAPACSR